MPVWTHLFICRFWGSGLWSLRPSTQFHSERTGQNWFSVNFDKIPNLYFSDFEHVIFEILMKLASVSSYYFQKWLYDVNFMILQWFRKSLQMRICFSFCFFGDRRVHQFAINSKVLQRFISFSFCSFLSVFINLFF